MNYALMKLKFQKAKARNMKGLEILYKRVYRRIKWIDQVI